ncbi:MAG: hypothetical protein QMD08_03170 [Actinomycetota bacterium]|nr:hypothetical protein [Actinomycetota bacterium]
MNEAFFSKNAKVQRIIFLREKGISLVELLLVASITFIALVGAYNLFETSLSTHRISDEQLRAQEIARRNLLLTSKNIRQSKEMRLAQDYLIEVKSDIDDDEVGEVVRFYLQGGEFYQTVEGGTPRKLADCVRNQTLGRPIFIYYDLNHAEINPADPRVLTHTRSVKIRLVIDVNEKELPPAYTLESEVKLRNL